MLIAKLKTDREVADNFETKELLGYLISEVAKLSTSKPTNSQVLEVLNRARDKLKAALSIHFNQGLCDDLAVVCSYIPQKLTGVTLKREIEDFMFFHDEYCNLKIIQGLEAEAEKLRYIFDKDEALKFIGEVHDEIERNE